MKMDCEMKNIIARSKTKYPPRKRKRVREEKSDGKGRF
jgi:hypothetical protein